MVFYYNIKISVHNTFGFNKIYGAAAALVNELKEGNSCRSQGGGISVRDDFFFFVRVYFNFLNRHFIRFPWATPY